jgi:hypothetical protein
MIRMIAAALLLAASSPASAMPDFVPKPSEVYEGYVALEMPRTEVPVGALWIQGYGPSGDGAAADNLVTERSLSQVTINSDLQLGLTAGILNLFGLDPSYRNKLSARFGDLSIVRVKDMSKLSGPTGEPRIYEAVRAGTVTITTDNELGLDLDTRAAGRNLPVVGRSDNGRRRSFSMDGKDMFIAFRVASQEEVKSEPRQVKLRRRSEGLEGEASGRSFTIQAGIGDCDGSAPGASITSPPPASLASADVPASPAGTPIRTVTGAQQTDLIGSLRARPPKNDTPLFYNLRVPIADGQGGLYDRAIVTLPNSGPGPTSVAASPPLCSVAAKSIETNLQLLGTRLQTFRHPKAPRW